MSLFSSQDTLLAEKVLSAARKKNLMLVTAESCTGGIIAGCLTEIAGCSDVFERGFVSYSYDAKSDQLGVNPKTISLQGAVSEETALEMADGALKSSAAHISVAVTGIAGPGGATAEKPVGLVYIATSNKMTAQTRAIKHLFSGDRSAVRLATLRAALDMLHEEINASLDQRP